MSFLYLGLPLTTEAMGIWRFAGAFTVAQRQSECGSKTHLNARQAANEHRRVLGGRSLRQLVEQTSTEKNEQNHANHNSVA